MQAIRCNNSRKKAVYVQNILNVWKKCTTANCGKIIKRVTIIGRKCIKKIKFAENYKFQQKYNITTLLSRSLPFDVIVAVKVIVGLTKQYAGSYLYAKSFETKKSVYECIEI